MREAQIHRGVNADTAGLQRSGRHDIDEKLGRAQDAGQNRVVAAHLPGVGQQARRPLAGVALGQRVKKEQRDDLHSVAKKQVLAVIDQFRIGPVGQGRVRREEGVDFRIARPPSSGQRPIDKRVQLRIGLVAHPVQKLREILRGSWRLRQTHRLAPRQGFI